MGSIVNKRGGGEDDYIWPYNENANLHFEIEQDIHTSTKNYEEIDFNLDLDLLTISY